jgi:hypothetical protein
MNPMRISWTEHVSLMGIRGMHAAFWCESQKAHDHYEELDAGRRIILKIDLRKIG